MTRLLAYKKTQALLLGFIFSLFLSILPAIKVYAACDNATPCKPYFKVLGADIFTGGAYATDASGTCSLNSSDPASLYQDPEYHSIGVPSAYSLNVKDNRTGGIMAYTHSSGGLVNYHGSGGRYAAFSLGSIDPPGSDPFYGYYAGDTPSQNTSAPNALTFSNNDPWGGYFQSGKGGTVRYNHCIPNYYDEHLKPSAKDLGSNLPTDYQLDVSADLAAKGNQQYKISDAGHLLLKASTGVPCGTKVSLFVGQGVVSINGDIKYASGCTADTIPKFAVIADQGDIRILPTVREIDGLYISQNEDYAGDSAGAFSEHLPGFWDDGDEGVIWTCSPAGHPLETTGISLPPGATDPDVPTDALDGGYIRQNCASKLIVNGALIAARINPTRIDLNGGIDVAGGSEDDITGALSGNPSEIFNYTPEMVINGGFFNDDKTTSSTPGKVDSIVSLPPVF